MAEALESIVAWYGEKTGDFREFLIELQQVITDVLGEVFVPYPLDNVHATLIDVSRNSRGQNLVMAAADPETATAKLAALEDWLADEFVEPLRIRFGGTRPEDSVQLSHGSPRSQRRFSVQGPKAVLIGWNEDEADRLGRNRRACEDFGFRHRYHGARSANDEDCYLRVGLLPKPELARDKLDDVVRRVREFLDERECHVELGAAQLRLVEYCDDRLPAETTKARALAAAHAPPGA